MFDLASKSCLQDSDGNPRSVAAPKDLVTTWFHHPAHGAAFRQLMDSIVEKFGPENEVESKKRAAGAALPGPIAKRPKLDLQFMQHDNIGGTETMQANDIAHAQKPERPQALQNLNNPQLRLPGASAEHQSARRCHGPVPELPQR